MLTAARPPPTGKGGQQARVTSRVQPASPLPVSPSHQQGTRPLTDTKARGPQEPVLGHGEHRGTLPPRQSLGLRQATHCLRPQPFWGRHSQGPRGSRARVAGVDGEEGGVHSRPGRSRHVGKDTCMGLWSRPRGR